MKTLDKIKNYDDSSLRFTDEIFALFQSVPTPIVTYDDQLLVRIYNNAWKKLFISSYNNISLRSFFDEKSILELELLQKHYHDTEDKEYSALLTHPETGQWKGIYSQMHTESGELLNVLVLIDYTQENKNNTSLETSNRILETLSLFHRITAIYESEDEILKNICTAIVDRGAYLMAWIGYYDDKNEIVRPVAYAGYEQGYIEKLNIDMKDPVRSGGPVGRSIHEGNPVVVKDTHHDVTFRPWMEEAEMRGYNSTIALPLVMNETVIGALAIYSSEVNTFDSEEVKTLTRLADELCYVIINARLKNLYALAERERSLIHERLVEMQKQEAVGLLARGLAHDLDNYMGVVRGYLQFIKRDLPQGSRSLDDVKRIEETVGRTTDLTRQLRTLGKNSKPTSSVLKLNDIVRTNVHLMEVVLKHVELELHLQEDLKPIFGDIGQMEQIISNLLINAVQAMDGPGKITITTSNLSLTKKELLTFPGLSSRDCVCLCVSDTGPGIPEDDQDLIFEPFFSTKGKDATRGLGLYVVQSVVSLHRGYIKLVSQPGEGASFHILFPAYEKS